MEKLAVELKEAFDQDFVKLSQELKLKNGRCTVTLTNKIPDHWHAYIASVAGTFLYSDGTSSTFGPEQTNIPSGQTYTAVSKSNDDCVVETQIYYGVFVPGQPLISQQAHDKVPTGRCRMVWPIVIEPARSSELAIHFGEGLTREA